MQMMTLPAGFNPALAPQPAKIDPNQAQAALQGPSSFAPPSPFANPIRRPAPRPMVRPDPRPMGPQGRPLMMPGGINLRDLLPTGFNPAYAPQPISGGFRPQQLPPMIPPMMGGGFGPYGGGFGRPPMMGGGFGPYGGGFGRPPMMGGGFGSPFARPNPYGQGGIGGFFNQMATMTPEQYQMGMDRYGQFREQFGPQMGGGFGMFNQLASLTPEQYQMGMDRFSQFQHQFGGGFQPGTPETGGPTPVTPLPPIMSSPGFPTPPMTGGPMPPPPMPSPDPAVGIGGGKMAPIDSSMFPVNRMGVGVMGGPATNTQQGGGGGAPSGLF